MGTSSENISDTSAGKETQRSRSHSQTMDAKERKRQQNRLAQRTYRETAQWNARFIDANPVSFAGQNQKQRLRALEGALAQSSNLSDNPLLNEILSKSKSKPSSSFHDNDLPESSRSNKNFQNNVLSETSNKINSFPNNNTAQSSNKNTPAFSSDTENSITNTPPHEDSMWAFSPSDDFQSSIDLSFMDIGTPIVESPPEKVEVQAQTQ